MLVKYDYSRKYKHFTSKYDSRVIIYEPKMFIRLAAGIVVIIGHSCSEGRRFEFQHRLLDGHFFSLICSKICDVCFVEKTKINNKEALDGPFKKA